MTDSFDTFIKSTFGFGPQILNSLEERFEVFSDKPLTNQEEYKWESLEDFFGFFLPPMASYKSRLEVNILYLDLIYTYRGWRHSKGFPVRGQRTWSNAWSSYRSNLFLRNIKLKIAKKYYGNLPENEINMAYLAEDINSLWKLQWEHEWKAAKKRLKASEKNNKKNPVKIDLASMAQGNVIIDDIIKKKLKANKKKRVVQKNVFTLGFDPGFTKFVLSNHHNPGKSSQTTATLLNNNKNFKKTNIKKKIDIKVQKIAHQTRKKNKKSLWD